MKYLLLILIISLTLNATNFSNLEPSGITKLNGNTYIVSDNGEILVIDRFKNKSIYRFELKNKYRDFEGITTDGINLFVSIEGEDAIMILDTDLNIINIVNIKRKFKNDKVLNKKGNGLESIAFIKKTANSYIFAVANQSKKIKGNDRSAIMFVELKYNKAKIIKYKPLKHKDIAALCVYNNKIYSLSDKEDLIIVFDMELNIIDTAPINTSGEQEGLFIENDIMNIADDNGNLYQMKLPLSIR